MPNTVKADWKRRVYATITVLVLICVVAVWWTVSRADTPSEDTPSEDSLFGDVFQIDTSELGTVRVYGNGKLTIYTEPPDIEAFVEYLRNFRYTESEHLMCIIEPLGAIGFYDKSGHYTSGLGLCDGVLIEDTNTLYKGDAYYFAEWFD